MKWFALLAVFPVLSVAYAPPGPEKATFKANVTPFLKTYCVSCHATKNAPDGIDFTKIKTAADARKHLKWLKKGVSEMKHKKMPPSGSKQPKATEVAAFRKWVAKGKD